MIALDGMSLCQGRVRQKHLALGVEKMLITLTYCYNKMQPWVRCLMRGVVLRNCDEKEMAFTLDVNVMGEC